jgi:SAM-dependent methyltransferase
MGGYQRRIGRYSHALAARMVEVAGVARGQRVLDVGCGTGPLTEALAESVGPENVAAIDTSPDDVAVCASRVPRADVRIGPAEALPFPDGEFDAVLAQLLVHLVDDPERVACEMRRVARPDAPVVTCVWDFEGGMTALRTFWDAAHAVGAPGVDEHDQGGYRYATERELELLWRGAGLSDISTAALIVGSDYESFEDYWEPLLVPDGTPGRFLATVSPEVQSAIGDELFRRIGEPAGEFRLEARAWSVIGYA